MIKYIKTTNSNTFFKFDTEACTITDLSNVNYKNGKELEVVYLDNYYIRGACVFAKKSILTYLGTDYEIDDDEIVFFVPSFKEKLIKETQNKHADVGFLANERDTYFPGGYVVFEGTTPVARGSISTACRSECAIALKIASIKWCTFRP